MADFAKPDLFAPTLQRLNSAFLEWQSADTRGNHYLWRLLGLVHELAAQIETNNLAFRQLIEEVSNMPEVRASNTWEAKSKKANELLLVLLLGLKNETKARKSQWLSALKAANKCEIEPSQEAFFDWIAAHGGVEGARKLNSTPRPKRSLRNLASQFSEEMFQDQGAIELPESVQDGALPEGFGLVLVKQWKGNKKAIPIATFTNQNEVLNAVTRYLNAERRRQKQEEAAHSAELKEIQKDRRKKVRRLYNQARKRHRFGGEFVEYLSEWETENLGKEDSWTRITNPQ